MKFPSASQQQHVANSGDSEAAAFCILCFANMFLDAAVSGGGGGGITPSILVGTPPFLPRQVYFLPDVSQK